MEPTEIYVGENHRLRYGSNNWMLEERATRRKKDTGETYEAWDIVGYYSDLESGCRRMLRDRIQDLGLTSVAKLLLALSQAELRITQAVRTALKEPKGGKNGN